MNGGLWVELSGQKLGDLELRRAIGMPTRKLAYLARARLRSVT